MKRWRKTIIFIMLLVFPISMWASASMSSHCQSSDNTSHSEHMQMDDGDTHKHMQDQTPSQDSNEHADCDCGCDGSLDCSVSGCSASVISNMIKFDTQYLTQSTFQQFKVRTGPSEPNLLFRPPIISS